MEHQWSVTQEDEESYRRGLFTQARKGDVKAKEELQQTYGVRLWSECERSQLVYENPTFKSKARHSKKEKAAAR